MNRETAIFEKIFKVIMCCETQEQLYYAHKYLDLARDNGYIDQSFHKAIYFGVYIDKLDEIEF